MKIAPIHIRKVRNDDAGFSIQPLTSKYIKAAKELIFQGLEEHFGELDPNYNEDVYELETYYLDKQTCSFFIGVVDNELVMTGALVEEEALQEGRIVRLSVSSKVRKQGFAKTMVEHLEKEAKARQIKKVNVETNVNWEAANNLYLKMGYSFVKVEEDRCHYVKLV